jgi:hypothetical protein
MASSTNLPSKPDTLTDGTSLWESAYAALTPRDQQKLAFVRQESFPSHSALLSKIEEKRNDCLKRQWTLYTKSDGEQVKVRDVIDKVADSIKSFRDMVDAAVQYDPGHAALPWAAVRFFLQVSTIYSALAS